jgi:hypothetical protein
VVWRVVRHDFDTLAALCDDDLGIVDAGPDQKPVAIRDRVGWEARLRSLFGQLAAMGAATDSRITGASRASEPTWASPGCFRPAPRHRPGRTGTFECTATIVWKLTPDGWKELCWHVSIISADLPEALAAATG